MARNPAQEMVWRGRVHLGDEPGIFGDAHYSGLGVEFPLTLYRLTPTAPRKTVLVLDTTDIQTFTGYPGHKVSVVLYKAVSADPNKWEEVLVAELRAKTGDDSLDIPLDLSSTGDRIHLSVRVRVDTTVPPGLYDDFLVVGINHKSADFAYYVSFGFDRDD